MPMAVAVMYARRIGFSMGKHLRKVIGTGDCFLPKL